MCSPYKVAEQSSQEIDGGPLGGKVIAMLAGAVTLAGNPAGPAGSCAGTRLRLMVALTGTSTTVEAREIGWSLEIVPD
jgi:hypothetical protein